MDASEILKIIEEKYSWKKNEFGRFILIFQDIAERINSTSGYEQEIWCEVMDLFNIKRNA